MSLQDIFLQRAALEHPEFRNLGGGAQNTLFSDMATVITKKIEDEQARVQAQRDEDRKFEQAVKLVKIRAEADNKVDSLKAHREARLTTQYELNNATKLRTEFINRPEVKDFVTVNTNVNAMDALLQRALATKDKQNYVATDQGLITMYNKLTDPASVVRESEYARTPENLPMVNRMIGAIGKVQAGGAGLTDEDRKALVAGAKIILRERATPYNNALQEYTDLSAQYNLDPTMVTRGMQPYNPSVVKDVNVRMDSGMSKEEAIAELKRRGKM
jgi:hypothetical protein